MKRWIEKQAADPDFLSAPFRVVVMHIPPTGSTWHGTLDLADKYLPALNGARIDIMLCGHTHNYLYTPGGEVPGISFPVLINDDETWLDIETTQEKMTIDIMDLSGKRVTSHTIDRR